MAKFRFHKNLLTDSMNTIVEVNSFEDVVKVILEDEYLKNHVKVEEIEIEEYGYDSRIDWNTCVVYSDEYGVIGFTNSNFGAVSETKFISNMKLYKEFFDNYESTLDEDFEIIEEALSLAKTFIGDKFEYYLKMYNYNQNEIDDYVIGLINKEFEFYATILYEAISMKNGIDDRVTRVQNVLISLIDEFQEIFYEAV